MAALLEQLFKLVGSAGLIHGEEVKSRCAGIWRNESIQAKAIICPKNTAEVSAVMQCCHAARQPVVT